VKRMEWFDFSVSWGDDDLMLVCCSSRRSCSSVRAQRPGQALSVLHIKVVLVDADRKATPVPRHVLLISDIRQPPRRGGSSRRWMAPPT